VKPASQAKMSTQVRAGLKKKVENAAFRCHIP